MVTTFAKNNFSQVGDVGIDGRLFPVGTKPCAEGLFSEDWFPIQVKQVDKVGRPDIDKFGDQLNGTRSFICRDGVFGVANQ